MADDLQQHSLCLLFAVCVRVHCAVLGEQPCCRHLFWCGWVAGCVSSCYGGHSVEETPGSIPNPEAKLDRADGTALGRVWESRSPPDIFTGSGGVLEPLRGVRLLHSLFSCPEPMPTLTRVLAPPGHGQKHLRRLAQRRGAVMGADRPVSSASAMRDSSVLRYVHRCTEPKGYVSPTTDDPLGTSRSGELSTGARGGGFAVSRTMLRTCRAYDRPPSTDLQGGRPDGSLRCQAPRESPSVVATSRWLSRAH